MARRLLLVGALALTLFFGLAGSALATHCYVADKPPGAGAGTHGAFITEDGMDFFNHDLPEPAHDNGSPVHGVLEVEE
jgi:hypothetical protein